MEIFFEQEAKDSIISQADKAITIRVVERTGGL